LDHIFKRFKRLADRKKTVTDRDLEQLANDELQSPTGLFRLKDLQVTGGTLGMATATIRLRMPDGSEPVSASTGTGPVDAIYKAIDKLIEVPAQLIDFSVNSVTEGIDALGEVTVRVAGGDTAVVNAQTGEAMKRTFIGHGSSTDILEASAIAYLTALEKFADAVGLVDRAEPNEVVDGRAAS
ncbi:MAG: alpha-isopropylmalate synthase regulatory domain-containing protein, partial [Myxococcota bacterium]